MIILLSLFLSTKASLIASQDCFSHAVDNNEVSMTVQEPELVSYLRINK
jgi:hypothetical protein